ncbi:MAG: M48 family metallopeptidase [Cytophagales bacterium]
MTPEIILFTILAIVVFNTFFEQILEFLNLKSENAPIPAELNGIYSDEEFLKAKSYHKDLFNFHSISAYVSLVFTLIVLKGGYVGKLDSWVNTLFESELYKFLFLFGLAFLVSDVLSLPFQLYHTFVIEQKYGFNKSTVGLFFIDKIKSYVLGGLVGGILVGVLFILIQKLGPDFWWIFWLIMAVFMIGLNMFYTSLIIPLFNKLTPLEDGKLKDLITEYCAKVDFPLSNIFVIDGSKRSSKANAFFSGIGKQKKVVFYDTLLKNHTEEELLAIFAHEVGHYKRKHVYLNILIGLGQVGFMLFMMSKFIFSNDLSAALGAERVSYAVNVWAFTMLFTPISLLIGIVFNMISRKNEYEADDYAKNTTNGNDLADALKKLSEKNLSNLNPHSLYVFVHYSHPPMLARLRNLKKQN